MTRRWQATFFLFCAIGINFVLAPQAKPDFVGDYALNNWALENTNADGTVMPQDGGVTAVLTGGNNGSGLPGTTDLVITATQAGQVQFNWSYSSLDVPTFDYAGYLLDNAFFQLADTDGQSGAVVFPVSLGERFGFRVSTLDNTGEPGILTVTGSTAVPEPSTAWMLVLAIAATKVAQRGKRWTNQGNPRTR